jgi:hypothetical protein
LTWINVREFKRSFNNRQSRQTGNTQGTQDEEKQTKYTPRYVLDTNMRKQIYMTRAFLKCGYPKRQWMYTSQQKKRYKDFVFFMLKP